MESEPELKRKERKRERGGRGGRGKEGRMGGGGGSREINDGRLDPKNGVVSTELDEQVGTKGKIQDRNGGSSGP